MQVHSGPTTRAVSCLTVAALIITACTAGTASPAGGTPGATGGTPAATAGTGDFKVALIVSDKCDDHSWGQAHCSGAQTGAANTGANLVIAEEVVTPQDVTQQGTAFANQGFNLIVVANGGVPQAVHQLALDFPNVMFCQHGSPMTGNVVDYPPNLCTYLVQFQDGSFVAGALAGYLTETGKVATIGGFDFSVINLQMEAFRLGARYVNPSVQSNTLVINDLYDVSKGYAAATAQYAAGADFIFSGTDQATVGFMKAAEEAGPGQYVVATMWDSNFLSPTTVITSATFNLDGATQRIIEMAARGDLENRHYPFGPEYGSLEITPYYGLASVVPDDVDRKVKEISAAIATGKLVVPIMTTANDSEDFDISTLPPPPQ